MGIKGLNNLLRKFDIFEEISISEYAYKIVAIDTSLYVYKYKFAAGERWLTSFVQLISTLRKNEIHCVFIFDSKAPEEKKQEQDKRRELREKDKMRTFELEESLNKFLQKYEGREDELKSFITGMQEDAGKTYEEKMLETAKTQLGATGQMVAQLQAMSKSLGLSIASTEQGNEVIRNASKTVGDYAESQSKMYRPGLEAGYKQGIRSEKGTLADTSNYIDKDGNLDYIKLADTAFKSVSNAATTLTGNFLNLSIILKF
jgi:hypothetical protein